MGTLLAIIAALHADPVFKPANQFGSVVINGQASAVVPFKPPGGNWTGLQKTDNHPHVGNVAMLVPALPPVPGIPAELDSMVWEDESKVTQLAGNPPVETVAARATEKAKISSATVPTIPGGFELIASHKGTTEIGNVGNSGFARAGKSASGSYPGASAQGNLSYVNSDPVNAVKVEMECQVTGKVTVDVGGPSAENYGAVSASGVGWLNLRGAVWGRSPISPSPTILPRPIPGAGPWNTEWIDNKMVAHSEELHTYKPDPADPRIKVCVGWDASRAFGGIKPYWTGTLLSKGLLNQEVSIGANVSSSLNFAMPNPSPSASDALLRVQTTSFTITGPGALAGGS